MLGFLCDGTEIPALGTAEGLWLTEPDGMRWVEQGDERWIEGMTQDITFQIPVGWERYIIFRSGPDYGIASAAFSGAEYLTDAYAPETGTISLRLPQTPPRR